MTERFRLRAYVCSASGLVIERADEGFRSFRDIFVDNFNASPLGRIGCRYAVVETHAGETRAYDLWSTSFDDMMAAQPGDYVTFETMDAAVVGCVITYDKQTEET